MTVRWAQVFGTVFPVAQIARASRNKFTTGATPSRQLVPPLPRSLGWIYIYIYIYPTSCPRFHQLRVTDARLLTQGTMPSSMREIERLRDWTTDAVCLGERSLPCLASRCFAPSLSRASRESWSLQRTRTTAITKEVHAAEAPTRRPCLRR
jgi:hypothetical protein